MSLYTKLMTILLSAFTLQGCTVVITSNDYERLTQKINEGELNVYTFADESSPVKTRSILNRYERNTKVANILLSYETSKPYKTVKVVDFFLVDKQNKRYNVIATSEILDHSFDENPYSETFGIHRWVYGKGSYPYPYQEYKAFVVIEVCDSGMCSNLYLDGFLRPTLRMESKNTWFRGYG